ncbi:MAG: hypothetical protein ACRCYY_06100 [Trueperaceae bacterium]
MSKVFGVNVARPFSSVEELHGQYDAKKQIWVANANSIAWFPDVDIPDFPDFPENPGNGGGNGGGSSSTNSKQSSQVNGETVDYTEETD